MTTVILALLPIPIIGTVVRYRATYYPKSNLGLGDAEIALPPTPTTDDAPELTNSADTSKPTDTAAHNKVDREELVVVEGQTGVNQVPELTGPPTFSSVMKSVWREEKIEGTFKGIFPGLWFPWLFSHFFVTPGPGLFQRSPHSAFVSNILYIPYLVVTYRIIVSQHRLHLWAPKAVFHNIFSTYERTHPFRALRYSPLVLPFLYVLCIDLFLVRALRSAIGEVGNLTVDGFDPSDEQYDGLRWHEMARVIWDHILWKTIAQIAAFPLLAAVMTLVMAPVDVVLTRLAIQPVHGPVQTVPVAERESEKIVTVAPPSYLHLTTEQNPYRNFLDCFVRIRREEGLGVLYRAWFLTFLGYLHPIFR